MATLSITEYGTVGFTSSNHNNHGSFPAVGSILAEQIVTISASSTQCSALNSGTSLVELCSDTDCYLAFGSNPTAVALYHYLPAKTVRYYAMGGNTRLAVHTYRDET